MDPVADPGSPRSTLERPLFSVGGRTYRLGDVVRAARGWGELDDLERQTAEGSAALEQVESEGFALDESAVEAAAIAWRYERRLLAADELEAWLARWELEPSDWLDYEDDPRAVDFRRRSRCDGYVAPTIAASLVAMRAVSV
jgi:hypothetical protein